MKSLPDLSESEEQSSLKGAFMYNPFYIKSQFKKWERFKQFNNLRRTCFFRKS